MEYNTYAARYEELSNRIARIHKEEILLRQEISWYIDFDADSANRSLHTVKREFRSLEGELKSVDVELRQLSDEIVILAYQIRPGFNPRYWFSSERSAKKAYLKLQKQLLSHKQDHRQSLLREIEAKKGIIAQLQADVERYRNFDRLEAEATATALANQIQRITDEQTEIVPLMEQLHNQLVEPLAELKRLQVEKSCLQAELRKAESFERELSNADNSYERKNIHDSCQDCFGESRPSRVIRRLRSEIESKDRNLDKLDKRMRSIGKRGTRTIKSLVIDGNNICYEQDKFIGLSALKAISRRLSEKYSVIVVFDASIRSNLRMDDRAIAGSFGDAVKVHVVATKTKADETILDVAADPGTYVISNDRFRDYPDKIVVKEQRLFRFEILNGRALVHDVNINEAFATVN